MRQQINLYRGNLLEKPEPLQSRQTGLLLVLVLLGLAALFGLTYFQRSNAEEQLTVLTLQKQQARGRVAELEKQYPEPRKDIRLQEKIARLEREIQGQRQALDYFADKDANSNGRILVSLEGLARNPQSELWLNRVHLMEQGEEVQLAGTTVKARQIPMYLQMLGERQIFGSKVFASLKIKKLKEQSGSVDFLLESSREKN